MKNAASVPASLNNNIHPIIITGPTGVGKSAFAVELAKRLDGEIIGADAFQIYSGMAVLTAQPTLELRERIFHYLIGDILPQQSFSVAQYLVLAKEAISKVTSRGRTPILVGGTGLYIKAITHGLDSVPSPDPVFRKELEQLTLDELVVRLATLDSTAKNYLDIKNPRRVARAIEICWQTGRPFKEYRSRWRKETGDGFPGILLLRDRGELHARIRQNILAMFKNGVVEEVRHLDSVGSTASKALGLQEIQLFIHGKLSEVECIEAIFSKTRQYAKRQLTWFRNQFNFQEIILTELQNLRDSVDEALRKLAGKL